MGLGGVGFDSIGEEKVSPNSRNEPLHECKLSSILLYYAASYFSCMRAFANLVVRDLNSKNKKYHCWVRFFPFSFLESQDANSSGKPIREIQMNDIICQFFKYSDVHIIMVLQLIIISRYTHVYLLMYTSSMHNRQ